MSRDTSGTISSGSGTRFEYPDVADFPENVEPVNRGRCDERHLTECVRAFLAQTTTIDPEPILSEQFRRIGTARRMYEGMDRKPFGIETWHQDTANLRHYFRRDIEAVRESVPSGDVKAVDRARTRKDAEALSVVQTFLDVPWTVKSVAIQVSQPGDRHHYQQFADCETTTKLLNLHQDPKPGIVKAIIYLSEVTEDDGPFQYIEGSHRWEYDDIERIYAWGNSVGNYCHTPKHRKAANAFPARYRRNAIVGRLIPDGTELSDFLLDSLATYTSDKANVMVFDPCFGFHRGGQCRSGERVNLQVVMQ